MRCRYCESFHSSNLEGLVDHYGRCPSVREKAAPARSPAAERRAWRDCLQACEETNPEMRYALIEGAIRDVVDETRAIAVARVTEIIFQRWPQGQHAVISCIERELDPLPASKDGADAGGVA